MDESNAEFGLQPEQIDHVILTHAHHDHIGGMRYFRNAQFYIQHQELEGQRKVHGLSRDFYWLKRGSDIRDLAYADTLIDTHSPESQYLPNGAYHNQFWIEAPDNSVFMCFGIFGQYLSMDPKAEFAMIKLSTDVEPTSEDRTADMLAAAHALRDFCASP